MCGRVAVWVCMGVCLRGEGMRKVLDRTTALMHSHLYHCRIHRSRTREL